MCMCVCMYNVCVCIFVCVSCVCVCVFVCAYVYVSGLMITAEYQTFSGQCLCLSGHIQNILLYNYYHRISHYIYKRKGDVQTNFNPCHKHCV